MTTETRLAQWQQRVEGLSPQQKRLLLERLRAAGVSSTAKGGRLVAFYQSAEAIDVDELRAVCAQRLPAHMVPQRFIHQRELAYTPAGKLDRRGMRSRLWNHAETASAVGHDAMTSARNDVERDLADIWCDVLGFDQISVFDNFFEVGGDSLQIIRIISRASKAGISIPADAIFAHPTIAELAQLAQLAQLVQDAKTADVTPSSSTAEFGELPLLPIQSWFFDKIRPAPHHWNQSLLFAANVTFEAATLQRAVEHLLAHHHGLRTRFYKQNDKWTSAIAETMKPAFRHHKLASATVEQRTEEMREIVSTENAAMDLAAGPLFRVVYFEEADRDAKADGKRYIALIAHHLVVDAVSWQVLTADLKTLLASAPPGPPLTTVGSSLRLWGEQLKALAGREDVQKAAQYWLQQAQQAHVELPGSEHSATENTEGAFNILSRSLDVERTTALRQQLPKELRSTVQELLLSALVRVLTRWTGRSVVTIDMEGHGRESLIDTVDVAQTVGWCTTVFPVNFSGPGVDSQAEPLDALRRVKEQFRLLPHSGLSHGLLKYLSDDDAVQSTLQSAPGSRLLFNYLGREDELSGQGEPITLVDDRFGMVRDPRNQRAYLLELNAVIRDNRLTIDWGYCPQIHAPELIATLADELLANVTELVDGESDLGLASAVTPTDFPMADLDQSALDNLSSQLDELDDD